MGITQSMGTVGDSYDNAMAESFFASLKRELVDDAHYFTKREARTAIHEHGLQEALTGHGDYSVNGNRRR